MTDEILAERYRLEHVLGRGGMAEVHAARDELLERSVAVKQMLPQYRDDEQFIERFRREAQDAASLNHPNIVAVYDTGTHDGLPFIVMELVHGRSLAEAIAAGGLTEDRALEVCSEVCSALSYAHDRGLVHRDVKPGNILLAEDGSVKVTDFGIARAAAAESVTRTAAVLGTAAYLSPEQAQGHAVDARSDIYSLGVVLYEALTGRKPFEGDSAVTIAYQHVQETPPNPREWNASITAAAEAICVRAMAKNPANRYPSAAALRQDLLAARVGEQVTAPAVLRAEETALLDPVSGEQRSVPTDEQQRRRRIVGYTALGLLTLAATIAGVLFLGSVLGGEDTRTVRVPDVRGQTVSEATRNLDAQGLQAEVAGEEFSAEVPVNRVVRHDPSSGEFVEPDGAVQLFISKGPEQVEIPDVTGMPEEEANATLRNAGLVPRRAGTEFSDEHEAGRVISSNPEAGASVNEGTTVDLTVSAGEERVRVPPVENRTEAEATFQLRQAELEVLVLREFSETVDEGIVIRQDPDPGVEVEKGAEVTIVVSRGPREPSPTPPTDTPTGAPTTPGPTATATTG